MNGKFRIAAFIWNRNIVLSINVFTPFEKYNFKQYLNEHKKHFQNVNKTKFNNIFLTYNMKVRLII